MSQNPAQYPQALEEAFQAFNQLSGQLADSYQALENRVAQLSGELANSHDERIKELTAKEKLANRLGALLDALPGGVVVLDQTGKVQEYNPVAIDLLGEPLHGETWSEVINRAFNPKHDDGHDVSLVDGRRVNIS
ncbi:MAG: PAS domain-containing protein, partial [Gammaproteobacteria bacterium]|nr:PAS domain-containing protein [Gammaproteobacteria bacterium]